MGNSRLIIEGNYIKRGVYDGEFIWFVYGRKIYKYSMNQGTWTDVASVPDLFSTGWKNSNSVQMYDEYILIFSEISRDVLFFDKNKNEFHIEHNDPQLNKSDSCFPFMKILDNKIWIFSTSGEEIITIDKFKNRNKHTQWFNQLKKELNSKGKVFGRIRVNEVIEKGSSVLVNIATKEEDIICSIDKETLDVNEVYYPGIKGICHGLEDDGENIIIQNVNNGQASIHFWNKKKGSIEASIDLPSLFSQKIFFLERDSKYYIAGVNGGCGAIRGTNSIELINEQKGNVMSLDIFSETGCILIRDNDNLYLINLENKVVDKVALPVSSDLSAFLDEINKV